MLAGEINSEMPQFVVSKVQDALNEHGKAVRGSRVLVLGVAYKKDIDDVRESPALDVIRLLEEKGAEVVYHDPYVMELKGELAGRPQRVELTAAELDRADVVVIATDHTGVDYGWVVEHSHLVVDTRNATRGCRSQSSDAAWRRDQSPLRGLESRIFALRLRGRRTPRNTPPEPATALDPTLRDPGRMQFKRAFDVGFTYRLRIGPSGLSRDRSTATSHCP